MVRPMTQPDDHTTSMPTSPPDDLDFEVETEAMSDGRRIHYYRWPEPATQPDEASEDARV
jgi:hypothetical protein